MESKKEETTYENIAPSKLLNYVKKADLIAFLTPQRYSQIENQVKQTLKVDKVNLKQIKKHLSTNQQFIQALKKSDTGQGAWAKYLKSLARFRDPELRARSKTVRKGMSQPRSRFKGCLATKIDPDDYRVCLNDYDDPKYDNMKLVPSGLKKHVFNTTQDEQLREALRPTVMNPNIVLVICLLG